jgi:hypothetical protein
MSLSVAIFQQLSPETTVYVFPVEQAAASEPCSLPCSEAGTGAEVGSEAGTEAGAEAGVESGTEAGVVAAPAADPGNDSAPWADFRAIAACANSSRLNDVKIIVNERL